MYVSSNQRNGEGERETRSVMNSGWHCDSGYELLFSHLNELVFRRARTFLLDSRLDLTYTLYALSFCPGELFISLALGEQSVANRCRDMLRVAEAAAT